MPMAIYAQSSLTPYQRRVNQIVLKYYKIFAQGSGDRRFNILGYNNPEIATDGISLAYIEYSTKHGSAAAKRLRNSMNAEFKAAEKLKNSTDRLRDFYNTDRGQMYKAARNKFISWSQKGEFEKTTEYENRINNRSISYFDRCCKEAIDSVMNALADNPSGNSVADDQIRLGKLPTYDADNEQYHILCTSHGLYTSVSNLKISRNEAERFKENYNANSSIYRIKDGVFYGNTFIPTYYVLNVEDDQYIVKTNAIIDNNSMDVIDSTRLEKVTIPFDKLNINCDALAGHVYENEAIPRNNRVYEYEDDYVHTKPSLPIDENKFESIWDQNVYLKEEIDGTYQGEVKFDLIIEPDGSLSNITVISDDAPRLKAKALETLKSVGKWNPGRNVDYDPLRVHYVFYEGLVCK